MPVPVLLIAVGTRAELIAAASLVAAFRAAPHYSLPFEPRLVVTAQERTELDQTMDALAIEPDADLSVKTPQLADAALGARMLGEMEAVMRHHDPAAAVVVGTSATAWATGIAAYFRQTPVIHLGAGRCAPAAERPFPEWLHAQELARLTALHLCPDQKAADALVQYTSPSLRPTPAVRVVGDGAKDTLAWALENAPQDDDPTLTGLRPDAPRVLVFMRRREHHANALKPMCAALNSLAEQYPEHEFVVVYSLQAYICDAFIALLHRDRENLRGVSPLPYPAFVRELARARLVVTDSIGVAQEAALLGRPLVVVGPYSITQELPAQASAGLVIADMGKESIETAVVQSLAAEPPAEAPRAIATDAAGRVAADTIIEWWKTEFTKPSV